MAYAAVNSQREIILKCFSYVRFKSSLYLVSGVYSKFIDPNFLVKCPLPPQFPIPGLGHGIKKLKTVKYVNYSSLKSFRA